MLCNVNVICSVISGEPLNCYSRSPILLRVKVVGKVQGQCCTHSYIAFIQGPIMKATVDVQDHGYYCIHSRGAGPFLLFKSKAMAVASGKCHCCCSGAGLELSLRKRPLL